MIREQPFSSSFFLLFFFSSFPFFLSFRIQNLDTWHGWSGTCPGTLRSGHIHRSGHLHCIARHGMGWDDTLAVPILGGYTLTRGFSPTSPCPESANVCRKRRAGDLFDVGEPARNPSNLTTGLGSTLLAYTVRYNVAFMAEVAFTTSNVRQCS